MKHVDEEQLVQLATRVPRRLVRQLKEYCVRHDLRMQGFVRAALSEKLIRSRSTRPPR